MRRWRWHGHLCVRAKMVTPVQETHIYMQKVLAGRSIPGMADSPKDGHNLFYNRLVSAQVENVTTYLCWQDAIPQSAINHRGLTALPSARRAPSTSPPSPTLTTGSRFTSPPSDRLFLFETHQQFGQWLLRLLWPPRYCQVKRYNSTHWDDI